MSLNQINTNQECESLCHKVLKFEWHITVPSQDSGAESADQESQTPMSLLERQCQVENISLAKAELKQAISKGALWLTPENNKKHTQRLRRVKKKLSIGDELHFYFNSDVLSAPIPTAILINDFFDYSIWYKPYGMLSQGSKWSDHCTIARFAQQNLPNDRQAFIVHRLDRAATGLMLVAHTKKAASALSAMFEQHKLEKIYNIIVHGNHNERPQPEVITKAIDGKESRSTFTCLAYDPTKNRSLISVKIDSGRKHQIRIHAASIGMPVVGDRLHGNANQESKNLQLCAVSLSFNCPIAGNIQAFTLSETLRLHL